MEHIYSTDEYEVKIGEAVVDAEVKASSTSVAIPCKAIPDGNYLVSLEVNGTAVAYRDTFSFASGSCTVGDYTLAYSSYAVTVSTTEENDVVRLKVEPVKVYVTDAMKAAVAKVAPKSEGGGSGGGVPTPTADDVGKVLTVVEQAEKGTVIVPEQSVTITGNSIPDNLSNSDPSLMTDGSTVIVSISDGNVSVERLVSVNVDTATVLDIDDETELEFIADALDGMLVLKASKGFIDRIVSVHLASNITYAWQAVTPN